VKEEEESESEAEDAEESKEAKAPPKKVEEEMPVIYNCIGCTFENRVTVATCEICGTERPPMEVIIAHFREANKPPEEPKDKAEDKKVEEVKKTQT